MSFLLPEQSLKSAYLRNMPTRKFKSPAFLPGAAGFMIHDRSVERKKLMALLDAAPMRFRGQLWRYLTWIKELIPNFDTVLAMIEVEYRFVEDRIPNKFKNEMRLANMSAADQYALCRQLRQAN